AGAWGSHCLRAQPRDEAARAGAGGPVSLAHLADSYGGRSGTAVFADERGASWDPAHVGRRSVCFGRGGGRASDLVAEAAGVSGLGRNALGFGDGASRRGGVG